MCAHVWVCVHIGTKVCVCGNAGQKFKIIDSFLTSLLDKTIDADQ